jgi:hypothetical protein
MDRLTPVPNLNTNDSARIYKMRNFDKTHLPMDLVDIGFLLNSKVREHAKMGIKCPVAIQSTQPAVMLH